MDNSIPPSGRRISRILSLALPLLLWACGESGSGYAPPPGVGHLTDAGQVAGDAAAPGRSGDGGPQGCADGVVGCACDDTGEYAFCGWIVYRSGSYVACNPGESVCLEDHTWSPCRPSAITHVTYPPHR